MAYQKKQDMRKHAAMLDPYVLYPAAMLFPTALLMITIFSSIFITRVFAENLIGLSVFLFPIIKSLPTHEKIFAVGKSGPKCHF